MVDRYTKAVLTVIAVALVWLCLKQPIPSAEAAAKTTPPAVASASQPMSVRITNWGEAEQYLSKPVQEVTGKVSIDGPVAFSGGVSVEEPVEVTGRVDVGNVWSRVTVDQPITVTGTVDVRGN